LFEFRAMADSTSVSTSSSSNSRTI
jgi:hypothetical protein